MDKAINQKISEIIWKEIEKQTEFNKNIATNVSGRLCVELEVMGQPGFIYTKSFERNFTDIVSKKVDEAVKEINRKPWDPVLSSKHINS